MVTALLIDNNENNNNERKQTQNGTYCVIPLIYSNREQISGCQAWGGGRGLIVKRAQENS